MDVELSVRRIFTIPLPDRAKNGGRASSLKVAIVIAIAMGEEASREIGSPTQVGLDV